MSLFVRASLIASLTWSVACNPDAFDRRAEREGDAADGGMDAAQVDNLDAAALDGRLDATATSDAAPADGSADAAPACATSDHGLTVSRPVIELARLAKSPVWVSSALGPIVRLGSSDHVWTFASAHRADGLAAPAVTPANHPFVGFDGTVQPWLSAQPTAGAWTLRETVSATQLPPTLFPLRNDEAAAIQLVPTSSFRLADEAQARLFALQYDAGAPTKVWLSTLGDGTVTATRAAQPLFTSGPLFAYGARVDGAYVSVYACTPASKSAPSRCVAGRVPSDKLDQASAYQVRALNSAGNWIWSSDLTAGVPVIENVNADLSISYNSYLSRFLLVYGEPGSNAVVLRTASAAAGPWSDPLRVMLPAPTALTLSNIHENAPLAQACEQRIIISYFAPTAASGSAAIAGDVVLAAIEFD